MKRIAKRHLLLALGGISLMGITSGIAIGTTKNIYENQINKFNLEFQKYNFANKADKLKVQTLQSQNKNLQFIVQDLQQSNLNNENLNDLLNQLNQQKIFENGYKAFEKPLLTWKSNLAKKISTLTKSLKNLLDKNNNLTKETQQGITNSLNKAKSLSKSLKDITFNDANSAVKAFKDVQKAQNIFLNQLNTSINLIVGQINKHNQEVNDLKEQIGQRDQKIKELSQKLTSQLSFYLKMISQFKKSLKDFEDFDFAQTDANQSEKIKTKIRKTLNLITRKKAIFTEILDQMKEFLVDDKDGNDYSDVQNYDLDTVQKTFEKIFKEYDLVRSFIIPLYKKSNQEKGLKIVDQAKQISSLESQNKTLQTQIDSLNTQKTNLEENLSKTKEDLMNHLNSVLENQIIVLSGIEQTIRSTDDLNAESLANRLKNQINTLKELKNKYTAENYAQTFTPIVNQTLAFAQQIIEEYKISIVVPLRFKYQNTLENLNTTKEQLQDIQLQLASKQKELEDTQNSLALIQTQLSESKNSLVFTQNQLETLNNEITANKEEALNNFNAIKAIYDNLKVKANTLINKANSSINLESLRTQLNQPILNIEDTDTLEERQSKIKSLINLSTNFNNTYGDILQKDYDAKAKVLEDSITSLRTSKNELQGTVNSLQEKQTTFSNTLATDITKILQDYNQRKSEATAFISKAKEYKIDTSELNQLLQLSDLQVPRNSFDEQSNFINEYTTRIMNLTSKSISLQNEIINEIKTKTSQEISNKNNNINNKIKKLKTEKDNLQKNLDLANLEIKGKAITIGHLTNQVEDLEEQVRTWKSKANNSEIQKNLLSLKEQEIQQKNTEISQLNSQIQNQNNLINENKVKLSKAQSDLITMTKNYTKYKDVILKSNVYKNATQGQGVWLKNNYFNQAVTGYSDVEHYKDHIDYGKYFTLLNPGTEPEKVSVINKFKVRVRNPQASKHTFRVYYIDTYQSDDAKKLKYTDIEYDHQKLFETKDHTYYSKIETSETGDSLYLQTTTEYLILRLTNDNLNQIEFTDVVASSSSIYDEERYGENPADDFAMTPTLSSRYPVVGIEEIEKN
ncbi:hypothetical protein NPA08_01445 [Mycoplasmopsis citelli]|uniref:hypothetical protein n=1 Tax=Mycoplasmopsis citelli TaxID=171281 RepID=UPI0021140697|nr:hypothetical protein [Mycoplasmopsis citelli]UUD36481.1 hypothetical protein NPA08_01445 [Mycoplasmopsis citelli]